MRHTDPPPSNHDTGKIRGLGSRIVELRSAHGWRQVELGRRAGIEPARLSRIENGRTIPTLKELIRLRDTLGVDLEQMVFGMPPPTGTLRQLAAEIDPQGTPHDIHILEKLLHYLVRGYQAEHEEKAAC
ncbi:MAG TPA: helix-turn-helix transcriptional regulator [Thermoanaerobaculia bacterium]|nr:helix-turn-helix transcriptional regulator [Thermoanaerobaculia bacterium]